MTSRSATLAPLFILVASVLWGATGTSQAYAPPEATPILLGAVRMTLGGFSLLLLAIATHVFQASGSWHLQTVLISAIALAGFNLFFFTLWLLPALLSARCLQ
jgi:drug/metabolite transporter, DME family